MPERFDDAIKALVHAARGNGVVMRIKDRIVAAHEREVAAARGEDECNFSTSESYMGADGERTNPAETPESDDDHVTSDTWLPVTRDLRTLVDGGRHSQIATCPPIPVVEIDWEPLLKCCDAIDAAFEVLHNRVAGLERSHYHEINASFDTGYRCGLAANDVGPSVPLDEYERLSLAHDSLNQEHADLRDEYDRLEQASSDREALLDEMRDRLADEDSRSRLCYLDGWKDGFDEGWVQRDSIGGAS